jgi:energy-converting hydrogenase Eha subunit B
VLVALVPRRAPVLGALAASVLIALVDLELIAPYFFAEVAALPFLPQFADHLAWGAIVGAVLRARGRAG